MGLPLAISASKAGWHVIGIEKSIDKIRQIQNGNNPNREISREDLDYLLTCNLYELTEEYTKISQASIVIYCVPTPLTKIGTPDLALLESAIKNSSPYLKDGTLIINESTSYPGTLRNIIMPLVLSLKKKESINLFFAVAPERINPGDKVWNIANTPRVVSGMGTSDLHMALDFYSSFTKEVIPISIPEVAEASKLLENTFRLINISFINEFTKICDVYGLDIWEVIHAAKTKPYGFMDFFPSLGVGGHCIPVDSQYLQFWAKQLGEEFKSITQASALNLSMPGYIASKAKRIARDGNNTVLILGVAYKSGSADTRETPVKILREELEKLGYRTVWYDELVESWEQGKVSKITSDYCLAIITINQPNTEKILDYLMKNQIPILNCTNEYRSKSGIFSI